MDGSLAHVLERLLGYSVMSEGFHLRCIINKDSAAVNYTKLEYKLQRLGSLLPNGNIQNQIQWLYSARDLCNRVEHHAASNSAYVAPVEWLDQSRELHEKLATFLPGGTFREKMGALNQAKVLQEKFNTFMDGADLSERLHWVDRAKVPLRQRAMRRLRSLLVGARG